jgi:predicted adenine nucleotide alpha hydrolase (AANH) superfamily ATPase
MADNENYNQDFHDLIEKIGHNQEKPTLFLHACCGPCLTYPLSILIKYFKVTVGFFNPNIYPESEYQKRLTTLQNFIKAYAADQKVEIPLVINQEDFLKYREAFKERKNSFEGGPLCLSCHAYRMRLAYQYAFEHHYDYFTTVMTVSCKKPSKELNEIGKQLQKEFPSTKYLFSDFKKENGQLKGILISRQYSLYRQNYCGCEASLLEREKYEKEKQAQSDKDLSIRG